MSDEQHPTCNCHQCTQARVGNHPGALGYQPQPAPHASEAKLLAVRDFIWQGMGKTLSYNDLTDKLRELVLGK